MTTSFLNAWRYANANLAVPQRELAVRERESDDPDHGPGSSPFTWKIGAWVIRATSVAYTLDRLPQCLGMALG